MTVYYVDSAGSNTAPYDTWAKAANLLATIAAIDVAGDTIYCASTGSETTAGAITWNWAGTATSPTRIISADKTSGAPPATYTSGYIVNTTGTSALTLSNNAGVVYFDGLIFSAGAGSAGTVSITVAPGSGYVRCENCDFILASTGSISKITLCSATTTGLVKCLNCRAQFASSGQTILPNAKASWVGGSIIAGGTAPTIFCGASGGMLFENFDLTNGGSALTLSSVQVAGQTYFRNCKTPSAWTGTLVSGTPAVGQDVVLNNCDFSGTNYVLHSASAFGDIYSETTIVRSGGASDGTTPLSWKMVSLAASGTFPLTALQTGEFTSRNNNISAPVTVTVEFVHDSLTGLKDNEIWIEVDYYASSGNPQGTLASSAMANVLATPATLASSSASWTTTGLTNPNTQKMSVTFTPNLKGSFLATVKLCKSAYTVYVDPKMTLS